MQKSSYNALRAYQKCASGSGAVLGAPLGAGSAGLSAHLPPVAEQLQQITFHHPRSLTGWSVSGLLLN